MFCYNCGKQFEGNFCPNCGTPAHPAARTASVPAAPAKKEYPAPPLGTYKGMCNIIVKQNSIVFQKGKMRGIPDQDIPYSDIAFVYLLRRKSGNDFICVRTKDTLSLPFPDGLECINDPYCVVLNSKNKAAIDCIYQFLKEVAEINAYDILVPIIPPKAESNQHQLTTKDRIRQNKENGIACCPKCGSTSLSANKRGFSVGKALVGGMLTMGVGVVAGAVGSNNVIVTCLNCGHKWKA